MEDELMQKIIDFIKEKRIASGLSQSDLSLKVFGNRKQRSYISELEGGKRPGMTVILLGKILKELKSDIEFIEY